MIGFEHGVRMQTHNDTRGLALVLCNENAASPNIRLAVFECSFSYVDGAYSQRGWPQAKQHLILNNKSSSRNDFDLKRPSTLIDLSRRSAEDPQFGASFACHHHIPERQLMARQWLGVIEFG
uniref:Uncharacterized protein n=1 Tax=Strombidinopsis acuminata TaxID=141414 RepID=A0A7S3SL67_9SPIT|mmetsp:Transcript_6855/g.20862  ORF Transcript_6855/g.20862 Transcript_6855/m.20862 type:complete len:122 (+) Transcript_6855:736-1101(+)